MTPNVLVVALLVLLLNQYGQSQSEPFVVTRLGRIRGTLWTGSAKTILAFRGIPYAKAPVGELRFEEPVPIDPWNGTLDATKEGPECVQPNRFILKDKIKGSEDCLILNVYTLDLNPINGLRPVMVYIHGGGFYSGSSTSNLYHPGNFLQRDVVLVTINYRLGPLGFLSTADGEAPGNYGLLDQVLSFKWVRDHISHFGGDPNAVTIFGESAGGTSVQFHLLSPMSKGLFQRGIIQSGSSLCPLSLSVDSGSQARDLAHQLNCTGTSREILKCLRTLDASSFVVQQKFNPRVDRERGVAFSPTNHLNCTGSSQEILKCLRNLDVSSFVVQRGFNPRDVRERDVPFLPDHPLRLLTNGQFNRVPLIIGVNRNEGAFIVAAMLASGSAELDAIEKNPVAFVRRIFQLSEEAATKVVNQYLKTDQPFRQQLAQIEQMSSDYYFFQCVDQSVQLHAQNGSDPVYYYLYSHKGQKHFASTLRQTRDVDLGVGHADELYLQFSTDLHSEGDIKVSQILTDLWTSFASSAKPQSNLVHPDWISTRCDQPYYLKIDVDPVLVNQKMPFHDRLSLWRDILNTPIVC